MSGYFIAGTDTGIGKTLVAAAIVSSLAGRGVQVAGMKPVASGCRQTTTGLRNDDAEQLNAAASVQLDYRLVNPYAFEPAIAPHLAAAEAGVTIELETILDCFESITRQVDSVVVEGVGGWRVPLGRVITTEHMAKAINLPVILVVGMRLGCINHALLSVEAINSSGMTLAGWVANQVEPEMPYLEKNIEALQNRIAAPLLGSVPYMQQASQGLIEIHLHLPG